MGLKDRIEFTWMIAELVRYGRTLALDLIFDEVKRGRQQAEWNATHCAVWVGNGRCATSAVAHGPGLGQIKEHEFRPIGILESRHLDGEAADIYVIENGAISNAREPYQLLGDKWESMSEKNRWLGRTTSDLGHFERKRS